MSDVMQIMEDAANERTEDAPGPAASRRRRVRRGLAIAFGSLAALATVAVIVFVGWASTTYQPDADALRAVQEDGRIHVRDDGDVVVMTPDGAADGRGLVFFAGAKVEPAAYAATLSELAAEGTVVVVVRPFLNIALLEMRPLDQFTRLAPEVASWGVGGHSQGGVRACVYAQEPAVHALVLLASYCSIGDVSARADLAVLSVTGTQDALVSEADVAAGSSLVPSDAEFVRIDGVSHAQFGAYGKQAGDGVATLDDAEARRLVSHTIADFAAKAHW